MPIIPLQSEFVVSSAHFEKCPEPDMPEYAFIGRSNVGKSSLINMLTGRKALAKISGTPGKTQLINHFMVYTKPTKTWYLVDLPGYGYAKMPRSEARKMEIMVRGYLINRSSLMCLMVLLDIRHAPLRIDLDFMADLAKDEVPFAIVFTKADKLSKSAIDVAVQNYANVMSESWDSLPPMYITSATGGLGREELIGFMHETNRLFKA